MPHWKLCREIQSLLPGRILLTHVLVIQVDKDSSPYRLPLVLIARSEVKCNNAEWGTPPSPRRINYVVPGDSLNKDNPTDCALAGSLHFFAWMKRHQRTPWPKWYHPCPAEAAACDVFRIAKVRHPQGCNILPTSSVLTSCTTLCQFYHNTQFSNDCSTQYAVL